MELGVLAADEAADWTMIATIVNALSTLVLMLITAYYAWIAHRQLNRDSEPFVLVTANPSAVGGEQLDLVLINLGRGTAYDVRVTATPTLRRFLVDGQSREELVQSGPFVHGVAVLPPNSARTMPWGTVARIKSYLGELGTNGLSFVVEFRYQPGKGKPIKRTFPIEVASFDGDRFAERPLESIAVSLMIANNLQTKLLHLLTASHGANHPATQIEAKEVGDSVEESASNSQVQ